MFDPGVVLILIEEKLHTHVISFGEEKCTSGVTSLKTSLILMYWNYIQQLSFHDIHNLYKMADEKVTINLHRMIAGSPSLAKCHLVHAARFDV